MILTDVSVEEIDEDLDDGRDCYSYSKPPLPRRAKLTVTYEGEAEEAFSLARHLAEPLNRGAT